MEIAVVILSVVLFLSLFKNLSFYKENRKLLAKTKHFEEDKQKLLSEGNDLLKANEELSEELLTLTKENIDDGVIKNYLKNNPEVMPKGLIQELISLPNFSIPDNAIIEFLNKENLHHNYKRMSAKEWHWKDHKLDDVLISDECSICGVVRRRWRDGPGDEFDKTWKGFFKGTKKFDEEPKCKRHYMLEQVKIDE